MRKLNEFGVSGRCSFKTPSGHNKRHICYPREDRVLSFQGNSVSLRLVEGSSPMLKIVKIGIPLVLGFSNEDKLGTIQPHDDALVVTLRIGGYDVKKGYD